MKILSRAAASVLFTVLAAAMTSGGKTANAAPVFNGGEDAPVPAAECPKGHACCRPETVEKGKPAPLRICTGKEPDECQWYCNMR